MATGIALVFIDWHGPIILLALLSVEIVPACVAHAPTDAALLTRQGIKQLKLLATMFCSSPLHCTINRPTTTNRGLEPASNLTVRLVFAVPLFTSDAV